MGADFRFKRSKTSFLCKANKLRENYDAEVYVVIKRDQRYAIYASSSSSKWPPSLDSIKNSNRLNEVWYPENIHLLEPKKKSSPERGGEMQILELPPVWNSDNGPSATNTVWATDKETSPDLLDINYHSAVSEGGSHISGNQSKIQQSPNVYISNNPPEFCGHQSFYPRYGDDILVSNQELRSLHSQARLNEPILSFHDRNSEAYARKASIYQINSYNDEWDVTQEISNFQDQIPRPDSFNTLKSRLNIQKTVPSSQKPSVPSVSLQQRAQESENPHEIEAGNIILSSLGMEPPRFKTEMLQKNKRERTIFS
ncbi:hypothetical protein TWF569_008631 [Orbilia oligospora]|uniref:MADS-box domain-containing protein n=1 Tax=Orbilia oligospora TaxID=2813651 RepID=A0A7C8NR60_ORBOL|nr:hypothetical protein TWF102_000193 [Orbilia oligospora]KAF3115292.1 hypothetical protein TWF103_011550 [Orbilia oligospora]KAF3138936.1 hypothetical protein TWF569_008631 [Orbilia oligospora]KAF3147215.1 hypothetical protein TWF703_000055 [Orbilia oligospora]